MDREPLLTVEDLRVRYRTPKGVVDAMRGMRFVLDPKSEQ